jgi:putative membrane protein
MIRPFLAAAMVSTIAMTAAPPSAAQALVDPARSADAAFITKAVEASAVNARLATLAATRATAAAVKAFAIRVRDADAAIARELTTMADARQIHIEPRPDAVTTAAAALSSTPAPAFEAAFLAAMRASREAAVALFEAESRDGRDDEVKEWAARQLPALREHLTTVRGLRPRPTS